MSTLDTLKKAKAYARKRFNWLRNSPEHQSSHVSFAATAALKEAAEMFGLGFGIEGMADAPAGRHGISYINMGDAYAATVIYDSRSDRFTIGAWGGIVERHPNRFQA